MQAWITVDDLNNYIKNYQRILDEIKFLENRCLEIETELTKTGGSIITVTKDQKTNATGITLRQNELFHYLCHYQDGIESLRNRLSIIEDYLNYLKDNNEVAYEIILLRLKGYSLEVIGGMNDIRYEPSSVWYIIQDSIKQYLKYKNHIEVKDEF